MSGMQTIERVRDMQAWSDRVRQAGQRVGFVPTMGYLHAGHMSLVREARRCTDRCVVSIFVNPLQFGASEDLGRYPRDLARDRELLERESVDALYLPTEETMYPPGFQTTVSVAHVTEGLCGETRPGHFSGVATVVAKLFNAVKPHVAVFGEKDFQQLVTIRRMAADLDFDVEVVGAPTVRESDGLAMSSRNSYLSETERQAALCLSRAIRAAEGIVAGGESRTDRIVAEAKRVISAEPLARIDYVELVDPRTMRSSPEIHGPARLALAVFIGKTRLIDNAVLNGGSRHVSQHAAQ